MTATPSTIVSAVVRRSTRLDRACEAFLDELGDWIHACVRRYEAAPPTGGHDQATYITSWEPWLRARDTRRVRRFLARSRDTIAAHFGRSGRWRHGYWRMGDVHHATEHFELFLGTLCRMDRGDAATGAHLVDAVEHMGNWSDAVPPWFDWESGLFHSKYFGSDGVGASSNLHVNVPDHLRCVNLCLQAYDVTHSSRYLELAVRHGGQWAEAILADSRLPVAIGRSGPLYVSSAPTVALRRSAYQRLTSTIRRFTPRRVVRLARATHLSEVDKAERFLASNGVMTFLHLWRSSEQRRFRDAAERLIEPLITQLGDPDAAAVAHVLRVYRTVTGDRRYDTCVLEHVDELAPWSFAELSVDLSSPRYERQPSGVGKRKDMLRWLEDGRPRRHSPALLSLAAEIRGDWDLAARAVDLARTYFTIATQCLPDGREHGCAARTVNGVARGHGRDNGTGVVTGVLAPMLESAAFAA